MSVLNTAILSTLLPSTDILSKLSYDRVFFGRSASNCELKELSKYSFLSNMKDSSAYFNTQQFQCATGSSVRNPFISTYDELSITNFTCACSIVNNATEFTITPNQIINGVTDTAFVNTFLQFYNTNTNVWNFVLDSVTGLPYVFSSGVNVFEPSPTFAFGITTFRLINLNNNRVSPSVIVDVLECGNFILTEDSSYVLQENSSLIELE